MPNKVITAAKGGRTETIPYMNATQMKEALRAGALSAYSHLYTDLPAQTQRMMDAIDRFGALYGEEREITLFSVPGRSEISGNHTDHNRGEVLAGAIDRDIIAVASPNEEGQIRFRSEGYNEDVVDLSRIDRPDRFRKGSSQALIAGIAAGFQGKELSIGGFDAYSTTQVLKGSGISSSAAFEVMVGNIMNHFYNDGTVSPVQIATLAQFAENVYFGKPCGLMDQAACAVGGFVHMDFRDEDAPIIEPVDFSLSEAGYALCIINTGGNHANLTPDYAAVPAEMKAVAAALGVCVLRDTDEEALSAAIPTLRKTVGDRAILRAIHFFRENRRVQAATAALKTADIEGFFAAVRASGRSSFEYLQNVYTTQNVNEQGLSLALALAEGFLADKPGAARVHGGGFAGTIQVFVRLADAQALVTWMDGVFGTGAAQLFRIRPAGAVKLLG